MESRGRTALKNIVMSFDDTTAGGKQITEIRWHKLLFRQPYRIQGDNIYSIHRVYSYARYVRCLKKNFFYTSGFRIFTCNIARRRFR